MLVIDDNELVCKALALTLSDECDVALETSGRAVLERLTSGDRFDLVLCDLLMPGMTGMDLYTEISRRWPDVAARVVFMTGGASTPDARAFVADFASRCVEKPIGARQLHELVRARAGFRER